MRVHFVYYAVAAAVAAAVTALLLFVFLHIDKTNKMFVEYLVQSL